MQDSHVRQIIGAARGPCPLPSGKHFKIRLTDLYPGSANKKVQCNPETQQPKEVENTYEAFSYVWGCPDKTVDIECDDDKVPVTVNLTDALRSFRHP